MCLKATLLPDVECPDRHEDGDEIWPEHRAHNGDYLNCVYVSTVRGCCFRAGS